MGLLALKVSAASSVAGTVQPGTVQVRSALVKNSSTVGLVLSNIGNQGPPGVGANWRGLWSSGTTYALGDGVTGSDGRNYVSLSAGNLNHNPTSTTGFWSDLFPLIGVPLSETGSTGDVLAVRSDGTLHRYRPETISAATFGIVGDVASVAFTSASGTTLTYSAAQTSDIGKTVCIPGGGLDDGAGIKDGFTTTIASVTPGVSATLANTVPTTVNSGTNLRFIIGTDNTTALQAFIAALANGGSGFVPAGAYLHTGTLDFDAALASNLGLRFAGFGSGSFGTSAGQAATRFFYAGPVNSAVNGTGAPAIRAANAVGQYGLKQHGFSIHCLRALQVSTTVVGVQTISSISGSLALTSSAGFPTSGRITVAGAPNEFFYAGISGNTLTGVTCTGTGYVTAGGEAVRLIVAAWYWDGINQSDASGIIANGYIDNNGSTASANQGHGCWHNNATSGDSTITRVHARGFTGPTSEGWRFGMCKAGYSPADNSGNVVMNACAIQFCHHGFHFNGVGGPCDGSTFNTLKAGAAGPGGGGSTGIAIWIEGGFSANTWNSPHCEGFKTGILFDGAQGNTVNSPFIGYLFGTVGDGSTAMNFINSARGNVVNGASWQGYGTFAFDYAAQFASNTVGNRVTASALPLYPNAGTQIAKMGGTGNRYVDLTTPWDSPSTTIITATNASWPIPPGAQKLRITCQGSGGGGGGGGSASSAITQAGGAGGSAGMWSTQIVDVGANATLNVQIGAGGGGGGGGAAGGNIGTSGSMGGDTTVTGTGISVTGKKGTRGRGAAANSTTTTASESWGTSQQEVGTTSGSQPGIGGPATSTQGQAGGDPIGSGGGGGSGGMASSTTLGGLGGNAGSLSSGGALVTGQAGTTTGANGGSAANNTGAGGGGGGGGSWNGGTGSGAGGTGGTGGSGVVIIDALG